MRTGRMREPLEGASSGGGADGGLTEHSALAATEELRRSFGRSGTEVTSAAGGGDEELKIERQWRLRMCRS